jgi:hypothetical protein
MLQGENALLVFPKSVTWGICFATTLLLCCWCPACSVIGRQIDENSL